MTSREKILAGTLGMVLFHGCATAVVKAPEPQKIQGIASWYGEEFAGRVTASGEIFDPLELTAAHPALPFGTVATVTNLDNGETVEVRINDRGPYVGKRIIDLSYAAAHRIGLIEPGIGMVELRILQLGDGRRTRPSDSRPLAAQALDPEPPAVPFPMPYEVRTPAAAEVQNDSDFEIEVVEERSGVPRRRRVSADGRELESVDPAGERQAVRPAAPPAELQGERYFLQLGAFLIAANAEALRLKASTMSSPVFVEESAGFFRVRVGPFTSRERAIEVQEQLRARDVPSLLRTD